MDNNYTIKVLTKEDLKEALEVVWQVFCEFEAPEYPQEGVKTFQDFIALPSVMQRMDAGEIYFWGCYDGIRPVGVIAFRGCLTHICLLFVDKAYHGQGIAKRLLQTALDIIKSHNKLREITVNSSPYAQKIYEKMGFEATEPLQLKDGILYVPMRLKIK